MDHLLDKLGGNKAVADALKTSPGAVANWRLPNRAIPWKHRPTLARIAAERGVTLPGDFWAVQPEQAA